MKYLVTTVRKYHGLVEPEAVENIITEDTCLPLNEIRWFFVKREVEVNAGDNFECWMQTWCENLDLDLDIPSGLSALETAKYIVDYTDPESQQSWDSTCTCEGCGTYIYITPLEQISVVKVQE